jgi:hypothetical protein
MRDWIQSPDVLTADELDARIRKVRGGPRAPTDPGDGLDADTATAEPAWSVDATRVSPGTEPIACPGCRAELPMTGRDVAAAHGRLATKDARWLHSYVTMKETIVCGLRHPDVGLRGDLGTFINASATSRALPLFVASQRLIDLVDKTLLAPRKALAKLAGAGDCTVAGAVLPFPTQYSGPTVVLDVELGIGLAEIAKSLRDHGKTPLRGLGTLRTASGNWGGDHVRLLYMEFDPRVRAGLSGDR